MRIENPIPALYRGTEYFSLARTFRTVWGGIKKAALSVGVWDRVPMKKQDQGGKSSLGNLVALSLPLLSRGEA